MNIKTLIITNGDHNFDWVVMKEKDNLQAMFMTDFLSRIAYPHTATFEVRFCPIANIPDEVKHHVEHIGEMKKDSIYHREKNFLADFNLLWSECC